MVESPREESGDWRTREFSIDGLYYLESLNFCRVARQALILVHRAVGLSADMGTW